MPARRPSASPSATPSRRSATSRAPIELGIRLFAVDCVEEVEKIARAAPGARVFCRVLTDGEGAEWPLSRKFGCVPAMAVDVLRHAKALGLDAYGVSFHVGSQQTDLTAWDRALGDAKQRLRDAGRRGHRAEDGQHGRRFPDPLPEGRAGGAGLRPGDLLGAAQAFRQQHPGDHHRAGPRHGRQCRRHQVGSRADLEEGRQRQCALGVSSTSASSAASPRRWTRRSATRSSRRATADAGRALRARRPDLRFGRRDVREDAVSAAAHR